MQTKKFAYIGGLVMFLMGALALVPQLSGYPDWLPPLRLETSYGLFLGLFPMNIINKLALIFFGFAGMGAAKAAPEASVTYSKTVAIVMGVAAVLGVFPATRTFFGYWPLLGGEAIAHAIFAGFGIYFGYIVPARQRHAHV